MTLFMTPKTFFQKKSAKTLAGIKKSITFAVAIAKNTFS